MKTRTLIKVLIPLVVIIIIYFAGPSPDRPQYNPALPVVPSGAEALENYIATKEQQHNIKYDNEARIVWADSTKQKTPYCLVYLHGFSASQKEGDPVHLRFAQQFHCNLYLPRLSDHGIDTTESLLLYTADRVWESAKEALVIGSQLGERVILMSTSTGGTLALKLAADYPDQVFALINLSPNIELRDPAAFLLNNPWGLQIARAVLKGDYRITEADSVKAIYWNKKYRIESLTQLEELLETTMTNDLFAKVKQPSLSLYYFKNEQEQDTEVDVRAIQRMHEALGTEDAKKRIVNVPSAGAHVLGSPLSSKDVEGVYREIETFAREVLQLNKH